MLRRLPVLAATTIVAIGLAIPLAGCSRDARRAAPTTTGIAAPATTTVVPTTAGAEAALLAAYNHSWEVYADALRRLDASRLPSAFAGNALRVARQEVAEHIAKRHPSLVRVEHRPRVLHLTSTDGVIQDNYRNHSVLLDPATGQPIEPDPNEVVYQRQSLKRIDGAWKVVEVIEEKRP
jgi:hypothetical protein